MPMLVVQLVAFEALMLSSESADAFVYPPHRYYLLYSFFVMLQSFLAQFDHDTAIERS
jgi:hypothetical protein